MSETRVGEGNTESIASGEKFEKQEASLQASERDKARSDDQTEVTISRKNCTERDSRHTMDIDDDGIDNTRDRGMHSAGLHIELPGLA